MQKNDERMVGIVKNQWRVLLGFLLVLLIVVFSVLNTTAIPLSFGFTSVQAPLILIILGSAICGALIVLLTSSTTILKNNRKIKQLDKELAEYQENFQAKVDARMTEETQLLDDKLNKQKDKYEDLLAKQEQEIIQLRAQLNADPATKENS